MQADVERFLAQLYTNRKLREKFLMDRLRIAREYGLSEEECSALMLMPEQDLQTAAQSFERKRSAKFSHSNLARIKNWISAAWKYQAP